MTPLGQSPLALGADIVIHSATKFLGGHSDLIAGAQLLIIERLQMHCTYYRTARAQPFLHDSWALAKHLKTLPVRFKQSVHNAERLVQFLSQRGDF